MVRISTPKGHAPPTLPRQLTRTPEDVIIIDSGSVDTADKEGQSIIKLPLKMRIFS